jgi:hypothetical protein
METTPFELTPEQKGLLESLARETGKAIPALLAEALDELQEHVRPGQGQRETNSGKAGESKKTSVQTQKYIWEIADELLESIPKEELERLPVDGAAQHDHYIYGTPKRPA